MGEIVRIPLSKIALPAQQRQIRPVHEDWVQRLTETDPETWDAIVVRPWPQGEPKPRPDVEYEIIGGVHRWSAARTMQLSELRSEIVDAPTDQDYLVLAYRSNARHGRQMEHAEQVAVLRRLQVGPPKMSERDIGKAVDMPPGTVHNWLSERDTNAGRPLRDAADKLQAQAAAAEPALDGWHATPTANPSTKLLRETGQGHRGLPGIHARWHAAR